MRWTWGAKDAPAPTATERRVAKVATPDLAGWAHQCLYAVGRTLSDWERTRDDALLVEAEQGAESLGVVLRELRNR